MKITTRELRRTDWDALEKLFGANGACGGCWCMAWRSPYAGKAYEERKGTKNRNDLRRRLRAGRVYGVLAFADSEPVGWCSIGPRAGFPKLQRSRALRTVWDEGTWSVTCFFVRRTHRGEGIGASLLREAIAVGRRHGARAIEGYPVRSDRDKPLPGPFVWTGLPSMFEAAGFALVTTPPARPIYELVLATSRR
ncbi:MAG TPA: GNAT family N-acetyltransferase [Thermoanaerobaculia bacterium]|nr:GNAT family N-acetyltransferase [Thermoanaerobaculia bacterium]